MFDTNQDTMRIVLKAFNDAAQKNYGSFAYSAGYMESMVLRMLPSLPKRMQKIFIDEMIRATAAQEKEVIAKM